MTQTCKSITMVGFGCQLKCPCVWAVCGLVGLRSFTQEKPRGIINLKLIRDRVIGHVVLCVHVCFGTGCNHYGNTGLITKMDLVDICRQSSGSMLIN